ncbi:MAG: polysaccharide deacetylase family protein, partial [Chloroflexaceae bacterium]|nr:polysaccharide deacetylase family protein [Chloroflexaceae bacterium]
CRQLIRQPPAPPTHTATPAPPTHTATPAPPTSTPTPAVTPTWTPEPVRAREATFDLPYVPILMYHYIRTVDPVEDELGYYLSITPELFDAQMGWLQEQGYTPIRMDTLTACLLGEQTCPEQAIAITFDDGYEDAYSQALPILERYGFPATFYIVTDFVGQPNYVSWEQLEAMVQLGMEIGAHSISHPDLTTLSSEAAADEIVGSRTMLRERLGIPVESFCYPIGAYNSSVVDIVHEAGFTNAVTTDRHEIQSMLYELPRLRIRGDDTLDGFAWHVTAFESVER